MATRFVHYVLAVQYLDKSSFSEEEKIQFLAGALLPDGVPFGKKKETHFNRFRWSIGANRVFVEKALEGLSNKMRQGWRVHIELDKLWQAQCFIPNLYRLPGLMIRYGGRIGKKYYEELSDFDVWVRENLSKNQLDRYFTLLNSLENYELPKHDWIDVHRWRAFLDLLREDFTKSRKYKGPDFIGEKRFKKFLKMGELLNSDFKK